MDICHNKISIGGFCFDNVYDSFNMNSNESKYNTNNTYHVISSYWYLTYYDGDYIENNSFQLHTQSVNINNLSYCVINSSYDTSLFEYYHTNDSTKSIISSCYVYYKSINERGIYGNCTDLQILTKNMEALNITYSDAYYNEDEFNIDNKILLGFKGISNGVYGYTHSSLISNSNHLTRIWYINMTQVSSDMKCYKDSFGVYNNITIGNHLTIRTCRTIQSTCFVLYKYSGSHIEPIFQKQERNDDSIFLIAYIH